MNAGTVVPEVYDLVNTWSIKKSHSSAGNPSIPIGLEVLRALQHIWPMNFQRGTKSIISPGGTGISPSGEFITTVFVLRG